MDKLKALYDSYVSEGLLSSETTFDQFSSANEETISSLYNTGIEGNALSSETDLETFKSAWGQKKKINPTFLGFKTLGDLLLG